MKRKITLIILFFLVIILSSCEKPIVDRKEYAVLIGLSSAEISKIKDYDTLVIDADYFSYEDIKQLHKNNNSKIYSYLNIGTIENFRDCYDEFLIITLGDYENWPEEKWIDVSKNEWQSYLINKARELSDKGVDGFFLDNADVYYQYKNVDVYQGILLILKELNSLKIPVIINGGDTFITEAIKLGDLSGLVYGVNQETVFTSIDFGNNTFGNSSTEERNYFQEYLSSCKDYGLQVYLTEYGAGKKLRKEIAKYCNENKFIYYISYSLELNDK